MQPVSFFSTRHFPVQQSPMINPSLAVKASFNSLSPLGIQHRRADSFQRFSGIPEAQKMIDEGQEIKLLYWAWLKTAKDRATCLANNGKGISDEAIAAVLVVQGLAEQGLTNKKKRKLFDMGIGSLPVAPMLRQKLTYPQIATLLAKALKDDTTARQLMRASTLTAQDFRGLLNSQAASISDSIRREKTPESEVILDSIEIPSPVKATASDATNSAIQPKDPRGLPKYQLQIDGKDGLALPEAELKKIPVEDRIAFARFEFDRKNKLIKDSVRRKGKNKIAASRWDVPLDKIK